MSDRDRAVAPAVAVARLEEDLGATVVEEYGSVLAGEVSPTDYKLPEHLTYGDWDRIGATLQRIGNAVMWWLGEWWRYGEHRYGGRECQAAPLGYKADTLIRAARVCERIPPEERDERLSFGHYVALARLESPPRGRIRDQAIANDWTVRDTERAVTRAKVGVRDDAVLHEPVTRCRCGRSWPCPGAPESGRERDRPKAARSLNPPHQEGKTPRP
jgi:hypothetical protein